MENKNRFLPIKGSLDKILNTEKTPGAFYVATDTGQMFLDVAEDNRIPLGGTGIGIHQILISDPVAATETVYKLNHSHIQDFSLASVKENDLLLGVHKDVFYIITEIKTDELDQNGNALDPIIYCEKLPLSGAGSGDTVTSKIIFANEQEILQKMRAFNNLFVFGEDFDLDLEFDPTMTTDTLIEVLCVLKNNVTNETYHTIAKAVSPDEICTLSIGKYLQVGITDIIITASGAMSNSATLKYVKQKVIDFKMHSSTDFYPENPVCNEDLFVFTYVPIGNIQKTVYITIDPVGDRETYGGAAASKTIELDEYTYNINSSASLDIEHLSHGSHVLKAWMSATVGTRQIWSNVLTYQIGIYRNDESGNAPFIWLMEYPTQIENYEKLQIKFNIYDPKVPVGEKYADIICRKDQDNLLTLGDKENSVGNYFVWNISKYEEGDNYYSIYYKNYIKDFVVRVIPSSRNLNLAKSDSLLINLDATGRDNGEIASDRQTWLLNDRTTTSAVLKDFNWSTNGWKLDENNFNYLSIADGASIEIPLTTKNQLDISSGVSYSIEIRGKIKNIKNYKTLIHNITEYSFINKTTGNKLVIDGEEFFTVDNLNILLNRMLAEATTDAAKRTIINNYIKSLVEDEDITPFLETQNFYSEEDIELDNIYKAEVSRVIREVETADNCCVTCFNDANMGFGLGTQETYFYNGKYYINAKYKEDEIFSITYVVNTEAAQGQKRIVIYLNGLLTGAMLSDTDFSIGNTIKITSNICDFDLYSLRVYNSALNSGEVITNYLHDLRDIDAYDQNLFKKDISTTNGLIEIDYYGMLTYNKAVSQYNADYANLFQRPDMLTMPYMVLSTVDNFTSEQYSTDLPGYKVTDDHLNLQSIIPVTDNRLPFAKDESVRLVKVTFVNPYLDYMLETGGISNKINSTAPDKIMDYYTSHCPSFDAYGAELDVQGTSSQAYPRRNYKLKLKDSDYWIFNNERAKILLEEAGLDNKFSTKPSDSNKNRLSWRMEHENPAVGTTKFTLKIDYMESSGSYNTGFANMIDYVYDQHPLDYYKNITDRSIDSNITYKAAGYRTSVQGFPIAMFQKIGEQYVFIGRYNMNIDKGSDEAYGFKMPSEKINGKEVKSIAECWEMSNNQGTFCSFNPPTLDRTNWIGTKGKPQITNHVESRYHEHKDCIESLFNYYKDSVFPESYNKIGEKEYYDPVKNKTIKLSDKIIVDISQNDFNKEPSNYFIFGHYVHETAIAPREGIVYYTNTGTADKPKYKVAKDLKAFKENIIYYYKFSVENLEDKTDDSGYLECAEGEWYENTTYYKTTNRYRDDNKKPTTKISVDESLTIPTDDDMIYWTKTYHTNLFNLLEWMDKINPDKALGGQIPEGEPTIFRYEETTYQSDYYKKIKNNSPAEDEEIYCYVNFFTNNSIPVKKNQLNNFIEEKEFLASALTIDSTDEEHLIFQYNNKKLPYQSYRYDEDTNKYYITMDIRLPLTAAEQQNENLVVFYDSQTVQKEFTHDTKEYRQARFKAEFEKHWNLEYCLIYFVMTELLLCYDSRGKNLMIATWGPTQANGDYIWFPIFYDIDTQLGINNTGIPSWDYDTDASVNVANAADIVFSTSQSVLWTQLLANFPNEIGYTYRKLRQNFVNENNIENIYKYSGKANQQLYSAQGVRPLIILNADAEYKYIKPTISPENVTYLQSDNQDWYNSTQTYGYVNTAGQLQTDSNGAFFYAIQGDRDLSRRLLLRNRINYLDSYWQAGNYSVAGATGSTSVQMRMNANMTTRTSDKYYFSEDGVAIAKQILQGATSDQSWSSLLKTAVHNNEQNLRNYVIPSLVDGTEAEQAAKLKAFEDQFDFDSNPWFMIKPFLSQYVSIGYDDIYTTPIKNTLGTASFINDEKVDAAITSFLKNPGLSQQLVYIPGAAYLSSFGDLSSKYLDELFLNSATRITELKLGNPSPMYENQLLGKVQNTLQLSDSAENNPNKKFLLENIELSGLTSLMDAIDVTGSLKLKEFKALRTTIPQVLFGDSLPIHTIYLPKTINKFEIKNFVELTSYLFPQDSITIYPTNRGLYFEPGFINYLQTLTLEDDHLGYGSYDLLFKTGLCNITATPTADGINYSKTGALTALRLSNIQWTPFKKISSIREIKAGKSYFKKTIFNTLNSITSNNISNTDILNSLIYEQTLAEIPEDQDLNTFTKISNLVNSHLLKDSKNININIPYLEGEVYIPVPENTPDENLLSQVDIFALEQQTHLNIYTDRVKPCRINIFQYSPIDEMTTTYGVFKDDLNSFTSMENTIVNTIEQPIKINYDFIGWYIYKLTPEGNWEQLTYANAPENSQIKKILTNENLYKFMVNSNDFIDLTLNYELADTWNDSTEYYLLNGTGKYERVEVTEDNFEANKYYHLVPLDTNIVYKYEAQFHITKYRAIFYGIDNQPLEYYDEKEYSVNSNHFVPPNIILNKNYDGEILEYSYYFKGWGLAQQVAGEDRDVVDFNYQYPTSNKTYYPIFEPQVEGTKEACIDVTNSNLFTYINSSLILLNAELGGKITLPLYLPNGEQITKLCNFESSNITHIFWYNNSLDLSVPLVPHNSIGFYTSSGGKRVGANATYNRLQYFEMPANITTISEAGFIDCPVLFNWADNTYKTKTDILITEEYLQTEFFKNITRIEDEALTLCNFKNLYLPGTLNYLGSRSFSELRLSQITIGSSKTPVTTFLFGDNNNYVFCYSAGPNGPGPIEEDGHQILNITIYCSTKTLETQYQNYVDRYGIGYWAEESDEPIYPATNNITSV